MADVKSKLKGIGEGVKNLAVTTKDLAVNVYENKFKDSRVFHLLGGAAVAVAACTALNHEDKKLLDEECSFTFRHEYDENDERNGTQIALTKREILKETDITGFHEKDPDKFWAKHVCKVKL